MPTQLNQNTTNLQSILDAVNALPDATSVSGEIAITENGTYDVTKYASASVNVLQSAPVLLWTNANPTSAFSPQSVNVDGASYDAYLVEVKNAYKSDNRCVGLVPITTTRRMIGVLTNNLWGWRDIQGATATTVVFGKGYFTYADTLSGNTNNSYGIPTRIWGVKFTL